MAKKSDSKKARQKNGTGSFYHRKDGTVQYRVYMGIGADGKAWRPSFYGKDEKAARQAYENWLKHSGDVPIEKVKTVGEWADKWLEVYKKDKVSYKSYKNYVLYVEKHIKPHIGKLKFEQVRPAHIAKLYQAEAGLSASALRHISIALNGIFETAIDNHFCSSNPAEKVKPPEKAKKTPSAFTTDEVEKILKYAPSHKYGYYVTALLYTGLRLGELLALQWNDIDFENQVLIINKTLSEIENTDNNNTLPPDKNKKIKHIKKWGIKESTKTKHDRIVALTSKGVETLKDIPKVGLFVICGEDSGFLTPAAFSYRYRQVLTDLNKTLPDNEKVRILSPHKARHTYASHLLAGGANMRVVQEQLGHQKITTTEIYTHVDIESRKNNVTKLNY